MNLFADAAGWAVGVLDAAAGVTVTYRRPPAVTGVPLTAVVTGTRTEAAQPGQLAVRPVGTDRDYLIRHADLVAAGLFPPAGGDRVTEAVNGRLATFVASKRPDGPVWEWGEPERLTVRIRCVPAVK